MDGWSRPRVAFLPGTAARAYPLVNINEDSENFYIEALAPGVEPESIEVTALERVVRLSGAKQVSNPEIKSEAYHRSERHAGPFVREIALPTQVDEENVKATYKNGLLMVNRLNADSKRRHRRLQVSDQSVGPSR